MNTTDDTVPRFGEHTPNTLEQIRWKLARALELTEGLDSIAEKTFNDNFYAVGQETDRQRRIVFRIRWIRSLPYSYSIGIGEVAHHLRSALDHLVFALARPTEKQESSVKFPLCSTRYRFNSQKSAAMPGVPRGVVKLVERVQPYHCRKWPDTRLLGQIQAIDNWDKHRALMVAATTAETAHLRVEITGKASVIREETFRGRLKPKKIIARLQLGESELGATIKSYPQLGVTPIFDNGMPKEIAGKGVRAILLKAGHFIENDVLPLFQTYF